VLTSEYRMCIFRSYELIIRQLEASVNSLILSSIEGFIICISFKSVLRYDSNLALKFDVFNHITLAEDSDVLGKKKFKNRQKQFLKSDFDQAWSRPKFGFPM
jgi:hypothetical protein